MRPSRRTGAGASGADGAIGPEWAIDARDVVKDYPAPGGRGGRQRVLGGVSIRVRPGEFAAIVGPSGSGKTTLLHCLSGIEPLSGGSVSLLGTELAGLTPRQTAAVRSGRVSFVFQSLTLIGSLTALENVMLPARIGGTPVDERRATDLLGRLGLGAHLGHRPARLSGGECQRVAVARCLYARPRIVFADEPTGSLDSGNGAVVLDLLSSIPQQGGALVLVTHDLEAASRADRVHVLTDGAVRGALVRPTPEALLEAVRDGGRGGDRRWDD